MPGADSRASFDVLRNAVRLAVEHDGLRPTARAVRMTAPGLQRLLDGSVPRATTLKKLQAWYVSRATPANAMTADVARLAVVMLVDAIPPERRADAVREIVEAVERTHRAAGVELPGWIGELLG